MGDERLSHFFGFYAAVVAVLAVVACIFAIVGELAKHPVTDKEQWLLRFSWVSLWLAVSGMALLFCLNYWDNHHSATTPGHIGWRLDRDLSRASVGVLVVGSIMAYFFWKLAGNCRVKVERPKMQSRRRHKIIADAAKEDPDPRLWDQNLGLWHEPEAEVV